MAYTACILSPTFMHFRSLVLVTATLLTAFETVNAGIITQWTFEINTPADVSNSTFISGITADVGVGTASGVHASSSTDWSTPSGNGQQILCLQTTGRSMIIFSSHHRLPDTTTSC